MRTPRYNLSIDGSRLWRSLMEMAAIGATPAGGVRRLALTDEDKAGRDLFIRWCRESGCSIRIDQMGNIFARRAGADNALPPIMMGSHLDTVPTGGKFDGALGVLAGLEVLRTLEGAGYRTRAPLEVVVWTNEEGSRFSPVMISSGVFAGAIPIETAMASLDKDGLTLGAELARIGYAGDAPAGGQRVAAFFELHIEQGPILEREGATIGVVTNVQGLRWYELRIKGQEAHAGTTPMDQRHDALLGAAELIVAVDRIARESGPAGRATAGYIEAWPNGRNVVTSEVRICLDFRHPDDQALVQMEHSLKAELECLQSRHGLIAELKLVTRAPSVTFDDTCVTLVREASRRLGHNARDIVSGAAHDSVYLARVAPTAMIFVPCRDGLSHNEAEYASEPDCSAGCAVLLDAILAYDQLVCRSEERLPK